MRRPIIGIIGKAQQQCGEDIWYRIIVYIIGIKWHPELMLEEEVIKVTFFKFEVLDY